uniref:uncharacterized protein LOC109969747 n=1 Tax=Monopterus albus TaxID=43700 RepID=UPI0009B474F4|nr:uncharacterized protein LOC109969747 [Monopterus albus]
MGSSGLLILGLLLNVAYCLGILGPSDESIEIIPNITAVLGEEVYLGCRYLGKSKIQSAEWKRQADSKTKFKKLVGFSNDKPFSRSEDLSLPDSLTNLTVKMRVSSVDAEGEYICEFESEDENFPGSTFVTVVARPDLQLRVNAETINGTHYQSVSCSAIGGRPTPQIRWLVNGLPPSGGPFTVNVSNTVHSNGTSTLNSILHFPTHLQDEDSVTCEVRHKTLPNPKLTTVRVETYVKPNVTIKAEMVQQEGNEFWVVSCISSGGRPETHISLALNTDEKLQRKTDTDSDIQRSSVHLPAIMYEGHNVTCVFDHPKFTQRETRVITLPTFHLSGARLLDSGLGTSSDDFHGAEYLELQAGQSDTTIGLQVTGNVPRYNVTCKKDAGPLPESIELAGSSLTVQGPAELHHAGLYECIFSYHHLKATLQFNITVKPQVIQPVPPTVQVDLRVEDRHRVIECSAADAVPAANLSWLLPEGVSGVSWFNFTSHNGSHSVRGVLLLPACLPWELTAVCVINHPVFEEPVNRSITFPLCAHPNVTISSSTEWKNGELYTKVDCSADSVAPAGAITWHVENNDIISHLTESEVQADGSVSVHSSVQFLSSLYAGQNLTCMVTHPTMEASENRTIHIPVHKAPLLSVAVMRQQNSHLWLAVCECRGGGVRTNLAWLLPDDAKGQTSLQSQYEGHVLKSRLTYQFPLALHEGQYLTCVFQFEHGITEKRSIYIPKFYISAVRVLNHTTPLQSRYGGKPIIHRLTLRENHHNQNILFQVEGNVPQYNLNCKRSDGSFVYMEGLAMVFQSELTEEDEGLYICQASFYHHTATVKIQVEVTREDKRFALIAMSCVSSALAIIFILVVVLWVCWKGNSSTQYKKQESRSALTTLMKEPGSPEVMEKDSNDYAHLVSYSIVIDMKSTV